MPYIRDPELVIDDDAVGKQRVGLAQRAQVRLHIEHTLRFQLLAVSVCIECGCRTYSERGDVRLGRLDCLDHESVRAY